MLLLELLAMEMSDRAQHHRYPRYDVRCNRKIESDPVGRGQSFSNGDLVDVSQIISPNQVTVVHATVARQCTLIPIDRTRSLVANTARASLLQTSPEYGSGIFDIGGK
jgi:hypothetical protein